MFRNPMQQGFQSYLMISQLNFRSNHSYRYQLYLQRNPVPIYPSNRDPVATIFTRAIRSQVLHHWLSLTWQRLHWISPILTIALVLGQSHTACGKSMDCLMKIIDLSLLKGKLRRIRFLKITKKLTIMPMSYVNNRGPRLKGFILL